MLTFDFETTNHQFGSALDSRNRILMVVWQEDDGPRHQHCGDIMQAEEFFAALRRHTTLNAYNAKFEMLWFRRIGLDPHDWCWHDPMLAEKVLLGNIRKPMDMGAVADRYGYDAKDELIDSLMKSGVCPSNMPQKRLLGRCRRDVTTTYKLTRLLTDKLIERGQLAVYRQRANFTRVLSGMEFEGVCLDRARVYAETANMRKQLAEVEAQLEQITGGINMRSSDQLGEYLYETLKFKEPTNKRGKPLRNKPSKRWPEGKPKTDQQTLAKLASTTKNPTPAQKEFLELKSQHGKVNAALTKNLEFFNAVCLKDGPPVFHGQYNQTVAATDRLTSSGLPVEDDKGKRRSVQLQNMPRWMKPLFVAKTPGWKVVEIDGAQIEFRVAAFLGQDKQAMADILDPNFDAHCMTASVMADIPYEEFMQEYQSGSPERKAQRTEAKADTFKPLYGGTTGTPRQEKYYREFAQRYSGVTDVQTDWLAEVITSDGDLVMPWGMRFHFDVYDRNGTWFDKTSHRPVHPMISNYPVQNLATAEIIPIAIMALDNRLREEGMKARMVNTVHDSVIVECPPDEVDKLLEIAKAAFMDDVYQTLYEVYDLKFNVPLGIGFTAGDHWSEGEEITHTKNPPEEY